MGATIKTQFSPDALLLKRIFEVPQGCRRQDRPICDSEPPCLNRVPTALTSYGDMSSAAHRDPSGRCRAAKHH